MKRPEMEGRGELVQTLSEKLRNKYYKDAPDALGFLDLAPTALGVGPDPIRVLITKTISRTGASSGFICNPQLQSPFWRVLVLITPLPGGDVMVNVYPSQGRLWSPLFPPQRTMSS